MTTDRMQQYEPDSKVDICGGKLSPLMLYLPKVTVIACFDYLSAFMWQDNCHVRLQPHATSSVCGWLAVSGHVVLQKRQTLVRMCSRVYHRWKLGGGGQRHRSKTGDEHKWWIWIFSRHGSLDGKLQPNTYLSKKLSHFQNIKPFKYFPDNKLTPVLGISSFTDTACPWFSTVINVLLLLPKNTPSNSV